MTRASDLYELVRGELSKVDAKALPQLSEYIKTPEGLETAAEAVFHICVKQGCAIQTALSLFESEL